MKNFKYRRARSVEEASSMLEENEGWKIIAGGQSLLVQMKEEVIQPSGLVDISSIKGMSGLQFDKVEGLRIGAIVTHHELETSAIVCEHFNVIAEMEHHLACLHIRNIGTVGGNLCHGDPASDLASVLIGLDANVKVVKMGGERIIPLEKFYVNLFETVLEPSEILSEIQVPPLKGMTGVAYEKLSSRPTDLPIVSACALIALESLNGKCLKTRIVLGNSGMTPLRSVEAEKVLEGNKIDKDLIEQAAQRAAESKIPPSTI